jgi:hypothetical protein
VTDERLTDFLAERVMGWTVGPDRFMTGQRGWMPRWRFQPLERVPDAMRLLEAAASKRYDFRTEDDGLLLVRVKIAGNTGRARDRSKARALTLAIANALRIDVNSLESSEYPAAPTAELKPKRRAERR